MFDYNKLPEGISQEEARRCYIEFLFDNQKITANEKMYAFNQLFEIVLRPTYELLDEAVLNKISEFVLRNIDYEDFDIMRVITAIIPNAGLQYVWDVVLSRKSAIKNKKVVELIEECVADYGESVWDPYSDMRGLINENPLINSGGFSIFNYEELPDRMSPEDVRRCYIEFLFDNQTVIANKKYVFEQLFEISKRGAYKLLDEAVLSKISEFVLRNIDYEDFDIMDIIASIIPSIGLKNVWDIVLSKKGSIKNLKVVKLVEECDKEWGATIGNPDWDSRDDKEETELKNGVSKCLTTIKRLLSFFPPHA